MDAVGAIEPLQLAKPTMGCPRNVRGNQFQEDGRLVTIYSSESTLKRALKLELAKVQSGVLFAYGTP